MLTRIIALLLALARLADRVARFPRPIRFVVLKILRRAEIAGLRIVVSTARDLRAGPWLMAADGHCGNEPEDAIALAASFRLLALALAMMAALSGRFAAQERPITEPATPTAFTMAPCAKSGIRARDAPQAPAPLPGPEPL